jgi:ABC-2 type transport system permease protein
MTHSRAIAAIYWRELRAYLATPWVPIFVAIFVASSIVLAFQSGGLFEAEQADIGPFFQLAPWLLLIFAAAFGTKAWWEETRNGTFDLLLSIGLPIGSMVVGKFLAGWTVFAAALFLTFPLWLSFSLLGQVDHGATSIAYFGCFMAAGLYLAISSAMSALANSQMIATVLASVMGFVLTAAGLSLFGDIARHIVGADIANTIEAMTVLSHLEATRNGVLDARTIVYFSSSIAFWLALTGLFVSARRCQ